MHSPIRYGMESIDQSLKRGGKTKKKRPTVDKSIKINIKNVQQQQRDLVHLMQGRPPSQANTPNSSRVFSSPAIHYAYAPPMNYGNQPSVTQPLSMMRDISTQLNVPKKEPEPDIVLDVNPRGILSGIDYNVRAQPKSEERQYLDAIEEMRARREANTAFEPFENDVYDGDALLRQHDAVGPSLGGVEMAEAGANPLFAGMNRLPPRPPRVAESRKRELEALATPNRVAFQDNLNRIDHASRKDLDTLLRSYLYVIPETARQGNTDYLRGLVRSIYSAPQQEEELASAMASSSSTGYRLGGVLGKKGMFRK